MAKYSLLFLLSGALIGLYPGVGSTAQASSAEQIIRNNCVGCHIPEGENRFSRISDQRRTPEGWEMTIARMQLMHHVKISDQEIPITDEVIQKLVKYFSDRQGLAPEETQDHRYILERRLNVIEQHADEEFRVMCARCHSGARVALQRRTEKEWSHLVHFHLGQFPTSEYSAGGRDRNWFEIAINNTVPYLTKHYPLETQAWQDWQKAAKPKLSGQWRVVGSQPDKGDFEGMMSAKETDVDFYQLTFEGHFSNGETLSGQGEAIVYTGYEWRASLTLNGESYLQVFAADKTGQQLSGRQFMRRHEELGMQMIAVPNTGDSRILALSPNHLQTGQTSQIQIQGRGLQGDVLLGEGLTLERVINRSAESILIEVSARPDAAPGVRTLQVGAAQISDALTLYQQVDHIQVEPAYAVARVGDNGGSTPKTFASFRALAYANGPDQIAGTADDLRIGYMPASWSVSPFDEKAQQDKDVEFAGEMNAETGLFTPALAGPNPKRKYGTNNAGNLKVTAQVKSAEQTISANAQLLVTVQRWNNPPIR